MAYHEGGIYNNTINVYTYYIVTPFKYTKPEILRKMRTHLSINLLSIRPIRGKTLSKRFGGNIGCKDKHFLWNIVGSHSSTYIVPSIIISIHVALYTQLVRVCESSTDRVFLVWLFAPQ